MKLGDGKTITIASGGNGERAGVNGAVVKELGVPMSDGAPGGIRVAAAATAARAVVLPQLRGVAEYIKPRLLLLLMLLLLLLLRILVVGKGHGYIRSQRCLPLRPLWCSSTIDFNSLQRICSNFQKFPNNIFELFFLPVWLFGTRDLQISQATYIGDIMAQDTRCECVYQ
uniref:Uncharacterized protein n=1 Tax=Glossina austeni TaxID=7395 RepID=A0A1A9VH71_GLOAU